MSGARAKTLVRCPWVGIADANYTRYHDEEWGVPLTRDEALFEKLVLEGFQAGLSWLTILRKREGFRRAFDGFKPERIARYTAKDVTRLMKDEGYGRGYAYDHDAEEAFSGQDYFPDALGRQTFYDPPERGFEREIRKRLEYWAKLRRERGRG